MKYNFDCIGKNREEYEHRVRTKFDAGDTFHRWKEYTKTTPIEGYRDLERYSDSVPQNACFSSFLSVPIQQEQFVLEARLQLCISAVGPFATLYLLTRLRLKMGGDERYFYPFTMIFDPLGEHIDLFKACWSYIKGFGDYQFIPGSVCLMNWGLPEWAKEESVYNMLFGIYSSKFSRSTIIKDGNWHPEKEEDDGRFGGSVTGIIHW